MGFTVPTSDQEALLYARQLVAAFSEARWGGGGVRTNSNLQPEVTGRIVVVMGPDNERPHPCAQLVTDTLTRVGLPASYERIQANDWSNSDSIEIVVGPKR